MAILYLIKETNLMQGEFIKENFSFNFFLNQIIFRKFRIKPNFTTMKNFKRILLLITLVVIANKVLFSDSDLFKSEAKTTTVIVNR